MDLNAELERLYRESPVEVQREFERLQEKRKKARELADMISSMAVDKNLPLEVLELTADLIKEDCKQIRQETAEIAEEERETNELRTDSTLL